MVSINNRESVETKSSSSLKIPSPAVGLSLGAADDQALSISFFSDGAARFQQCDQDSDSRYRRQPHGEDNPSYSSWTKDILPGQVVDHDDVPLVYDFREGETEAL